MSDMERLGSALADRYRIERELGAGGMETVYLAHDIKLTPRADPWLALRQNWWKLLGADR